jgi:diaminohydroxyphosphoribosylaminopyrimidine deaminase/5-amino-6-(5-phosphoribosylamino)uracil reductase
MDQDMRHMARAIELARQGEGFVEPNPMVGCVIVRDGQVVGEGYHEKFGQDHAEVNALRQAGPAAAGGTVYVSLEPCCHHGKTPPCADALIQAEVGRVVVGCTDPSAKVAGRGIARLREAGIEVTVGLMETQARQVIAPWAHREKTGLPWIIIKWAATLDGNIATHTGHSQWISNPASRRLVHELRARVDAIAVGSGTLRQDDPMLTARDVPIRRPARRVVISTQPLFPPDCKLIQTAGQFPTDLVVHRRRIKRFANAVENLKEAGCNIIAAPGRTEGLAGLDLQRWLKPWADEYQITNLLIEGGARTIGLFIEQGLANEIWAFVAPKLLGDQRGIHPVNRGPVEQITDAMDLHLTDIQRIDDDVLLKYRTTATRPQAG